ncbi:hypothetical protein ABZ943_40885, partial [Streptomyces rubiginosohelvolus]|uniref:hypothetical protein n=1 Tax=Streptomyces rubiginosohelvolus TaxID=67362 RepID=UPI0033C2E740
MRTPSAAGPATPETKVDTLTYAYESDAPEKDRLAQVLVEAFAKAGIKLVTRPLEKAAFTN